MIFVIIIKYSELKNKFEFNMTKIKKNSAIILGSYMRKLKTYKEENNLNGIIDILRSLGITVIVEQGGGDEPSGDTQITLSIDGDNTVAFNGTNELLAFLSDNSDASNTTWEILGDGSNYVRLNQLIGSQVNLQGTVNPENYYTAGSATISYIGNVEYLPGSNFVSIDNNESIQMTVTYIAPELIIPGIENKNIEIQATNTKASNSPVIKEVEMTGREESVEELQEANGYNWVSDNDNISIVGNTDSTCTIIGNNNTDTIQEVHITCEVNFQGNIVTSNTKIVIVKPAENVEPGGGDEPSGDKYYWYAGVTDKVSFTESDLNQTSTTKPTTLTFDDAEGDNYQTFIYPSSWGKPTSMMAGGLDGKDGWFWGDEAEMESLPSGYTAAIHQGGPVTYDVTWE